MTRHSRWLPEGFFGPVDYAARSRYRRPPGFYRRLQSISPIVRKLGMTPSYVVELEVSGRRTGLARRSLLVQVNHLGERAADRSPRHAARRSDPGLRAPAEPTRSSALTGDRPAPAGTAT